MATTTTNFGWDIPQSTDLVKDGATAIAALGQDIDTAFVDLKGGTTGQVLAKASNSDLDFTWSSVDPLTILDAKGDLISATAADTPARLAVGTNGQVLTADSTTSTGLKWATAATRGMTLLATGTFDSTADITFSSISQSYNDLYLVFNSVNVWASGSGDRGFIRLNGDTGSNYNWQASLADGTSSTSISDTRFDRAYAIGDVGTAKAGSSYFRIRDYANSSAYKGVDGMSICVQSTATTIGGQFVGQYKSNTAITSITLTNASGGGIYTPASGTIYLYGVN